MKQPFVIAGLVLLALAIFALIGWRAKHAASSASFSPAMTDSPTNGDSRNPYYSRTDTTALRLPDSVWKSILPEDVYEVARHQDTERPFTGKYWNYTGLGTYYCAACGNALFRSDSKFASSCGWPSFFATIRKNSVTYIEDRTFGMVRTEVRCGRCEGHLGHLFDDGPPPTGQRYCMNSIVLDFEPDGGAKHGHGKE